MGEYPFVPLPGYRQRSGDEMVRRARDFRAELKRRRTVRHFSDRLVARAIIDECLGVVTTAPSGANLQPWHFVVVGDPETKRRIREAADEDERGFAGTGRSRKGWKRWRHWAPTRTSRSSKKRPG